MVNSAPRGASRSSLITCRPPERFDATTVAGSPSTRRVAPFANRSWSSLACSTKNDPSSPCGLPTRPIRTSSVTRRDEDCPGPALEHLRRFLSRGRSQQPLVEELVRSRPAGALEQLDDPFAVEGRPPQLRLAIDEERPERGDLAFVRKADATRIDEPDAADEPVLLHVRVAGHDDTLLDPGENLCETFVRSRRGDHLVVAPGRRVAVEDTVALECRRLALQEGDLLVREAGALPVVGLAVGIPAYERRILDRAHQLERLAW